MIQLRRQNKTKEEGHCKPRNNYLENIKPTHDKYEI